MSPSTGAGWQEPFLHPACVFLLLALEDSECFDWSLTSFLLEVKYMMSYLIGVNPRQVQERAPSQC